MTNLLGNAFKFTTLGSIEIIVREIKMDLHIYVKDTGIGIREEDKLNLMTAFGKSNSDESKNLNRQGVGLGLLISNMITKNLNSDNIGLKFDSIYG